MAESKSFLDSIAGKEKPESFAEEQFEYIKDGGKTRRLVLLGGMAVVLVAAVFAIISLTGRVNVPDLTGMPLDEAYIWSQKNKVTLAVRNEYSFDVDENIILSQDVEEGSKIKKNSIISVGVSLGPDPEELIAFPDLMGINLNEIEAWVCDHKLTGVRIETAYSDVVDENQVISYSLTDGTEENFKRKNRVTITVSRGPEALSETIIVEDFSNKRVVEVQQWGTENGVPITLTEAFDANVAAGTVISQSVRKGTEIIRSDGITVVVSKGKPVTVPDFTAMVADEASSWARSNNITLTIIEIYTSSHNKGKIYKQNVAVGKIIPEGEVITVHCSLGQVAVSSYIGKTKLDILNWQQDVNGKGANIKLTFSEAFGEKGSAGTIINQSVANNLVNPGTTIAVVISKGMQLVMPDFAGMTQEEVEDWNRYIGLKVLFDYQYIEDEDEEIDSKGKVLSQSIAKDTLITDADTITLTIGY